jgi:hypothetical protein
MSSHHIVKEDQEPALLILEPNAIAFEQVQQLLEWSPTIIVAEEAIELVLGWGVKIDIVLCLSSSVDAVNILLQDQLPIRFISYLKQDERLAIALFFLVKEKYKAVNILASDEAIFDVIQNAGLDAEVFFSNRKWSFIRSGKFEKWVPANDQFFIYPRQRIHSVGLSDQLMSIADGPIQMESRTPFWVGEELG